MVVVVDIVHLRAIYVTVEEEEGKTRICLNRGAD
jgi:hypothetical protein